MKRKEEKMKIATFFLIGFLLFSLVGCGGGGSPQTETGTPAPTSSSGSPTPTTQSSAPTPSSLSPTPTPSSQAAGEILPYPNARETHRSTTQETSPEGEPGVVEVLIMQTEDSYEQVKSYYEGAIPSLWKKSYSSETNDENGYRTFSLAAESSDGKSWFYLNVFENMDEKGATGISHTLGKVSGAPPSSPSGDTGKISPYPDAKVINSSTYTGPGVSGEEATWSVLVLETADNYDQVKDYYENNIPSGYSNTYSGESTDDNGMRTYTLWFSSPDMDEMYTVAVTENSEEGKVEIVQSYGHK